MRASVSAQITVEEWPESWGSIGQGCGVQYPTWCGNGYQAVGCRVYNSRGRAVLAKGSRGLIADNTFTHLKGVCMHWTCHEIYCSLHAGGYSAWTGFVGAFHSCTFVS